jgi:hypothetical protein
MGRLAWGPGARVVGGRPRRDRGRHRRRPRSGKSSTRSSADLSARRGRRAADRGVRRRHRLPHPEGLRLRHGPAQRLRHGRPAGWKTPILGKPKPVKVIQDGRVRGRTKLYPTGTWELKSLLAWSLKTSIEAGYAVRLQGRGHWSKAEDEAWAQQITAEVLREEKNTEDGRWTAGGR